MASKKTYTSDEIIEKGAFQETNDIKLDILYSTIHSFVRSNIPYYSKLTNATFGAHFKQNLGVTNTDVRFERRNGGTRIATISEQKGVVGTSYIDRSCSVLTYFTTEGKDVGIIKSATSADSDRFTAAHHADVSRRLCLKYPYVILEFTPPTYTIYLTSNNNNYGTVSGGGTWDVTISDFTKTITATANAGYKFVRWSDGDKNASRTITISQNSISAQNTTLSLTAYFERETPETSYVMYDSIFSFKRWAANNLASWDLINISNVTDIGFTATGLADDAYTGESRPLIPVEIGRWYTIEFEASGGGFELFVFNCDAGGVWQYSNPMLTVMGNTKKFNFEAVTNYISIRCDVVGTGTVVNFSDFRIYPADCPYMGSTVSAAERTDVNAWSMPTPIREGYRFLGWFTQPNGGGTKYTSSSAFPTSDLVLYSHWELAKINNVLCDKLKHSKSLINQQKVKVILVNKTKVYE